MPILPPLPTARRMSEESVSGPSYFRKGRSEENILGSPRNRSNSGFMTRSKSDDLRKTLLTATLSSSCPDFIDKDERNVGAKLSNQSKTESCDLLPSRLGGATQRSRALGIGLQRNSSRSPTVGCSRVGPSLNKTYQTSSENSTPVSSRRAAANNSSRDSPLTEGKGSVQSVSQAAVRPDTQGDNNDSQDQNIVLNGHTKLYRINVNNSDGNSLCSSAIRKSDKTTVISVSALKLSQENLTKNMKVVLDNSKEKKHVQSDVKKENKSFLKNLFRFKKKPSFWKRECNEMSEDVPETMTKAQYERCCQWLEEVERAKNNRCIEVSASPPPIWTE